MNYKEFNLRIPGSTVSKIIAKKDYWLSCDSATKHFIYRSYPSKNILANQETILDFYPFYACYRHSFICK
ncbi:hypothetical protein BpHYR1_037731 [Brachionus plicatilis]|uniref:Uncharacterized protein n=1 Tax=Brachionus plicatilis TaxID=10195 RepID=A0A3M7SBS0_BRAPC|nr:hypothetical protein BpHYR1_037731 [Brachionus plicatilis]